MKTETNREIAKRVIHDWREEHFLSALNPHFEELIDVVEAALDAERERRAKIVNKYVADMRSVPHRTEYGEGCLNAAEYIATAIRGKD